jgi:hypothetical protein
VEKNTNLELFTYRMSHSVASLSIFGLAVFSLGAVQAADEVIFNRDVRPILSEKCFSCHGFDPKTREADLRLDTFAGATANNDGARAIVPGDLSKSEAWLRINSTDEEEMMPPKKAHKTLSAADKAVLKKWIEQGAKYQKHWSLEAPVKAPLPVVANPAWAKNPIDRFVFAKLEVVKLTPAPEADRRTLARRVSLDLTGLPPAPAEVEAFVTDPAPDAYEKLVAKLVASPRWGEHRARYWLDAARYADTHGLHFDNYREMWPYRDWVIAAFNRNEPFDKFTVEQLAGDLLPTPSRDQLVATGFQRCAATTNEGGTIDEENLANYAIDRVTTTAWVWLGLSMNCAQCHDHKFDPILQKDFYSMAAFFRNTTQRAKDDNVKDSKPVIYLPPAADEQRFIAVEKGLVDSKAELGSRRGALEQKFEPWLAAAKPDAVAVSAEKLVVQLPMNEGQGNEVKGVARTQSIALKATAPLEWKDGGKLGKAPLLPKGADFDLGNIADFEGNMPFSVGAWVNVPGGLTAAALVARFDNRGDTRQGWMLYFEGDKFGLRLASAAPRSEVRVVTQKAEVKPGKWQHVLATYDGSGKSSGVVLYVNGRAVPLAAPVTPPPAPPAPGKPAAAPGVPNGTLLGSIRTALPLRIGRREAGQPFTGGQIQDVRIFARPLAAREIRALPEEGPLKIALAAVAEKRTPEQKKALQGFYLDVADPAMPGIADRIRTLEAELVGIKARSAVTHIQEERMDTQPVARVLMRGQYDRPGDEVKAATPSALPPLPAGLPGNRLGLAKWMVSPENPLPARVTVNRFWQEIFGTGLVRTSEDFGIMGDPPANPELLDWLAVEFRESGWDVKKLFTLIVTSSTYKQAALTTPEKLERDPQNRLLSRGPRFRMDAEMLRDYALAASGALVEKIGGPSVKPYQPDGVWEAVAMKESNTGRYKRDEGDGLYRRSLYTFWKRAAPPALMDVFNAPSRETCTVRRERTNTPLQALAMLNDPQFVEAGRKLAEIALKQAGGQADKAFDIIAERSLLRSLRAEERKIIADTYADVEREFAQTPARAKELLAVGDSKADATLPAPQLAALAVVASQIMSLDEAINK